MYLEGTFCGNPFIPKIFQMNEILSTDKHKYSPLIGHLNSHRYYSTHWYIIFPSMWPHYSHGPTFRQYTQITFYSFSHMHRDKKRSSLTISTVWVFHPFFILTQCVMSPNPKIQQHRFTRISFSHLVYTNSKYFISLSRTIIQIHVFLHKCRHCQVRGIILWNFNRLELPRGNDRRSVTIINVAVRIVATAKNVPIVTIVRMQCKGRKRKRKPKCIPIIILQQDIHIPPKNFMKTGSPLLYILS